jgi:hypothetical protein
MKTPLPIDSGMCKAKMSITQQERIEQRAHRLNDKPSLKADVYTLTFGITNEAAKQEKNLSNSVCAVLAQWSFTHASSFWFTAQVSSREISNTKSFLAIDLARLHDKYCRSKSLRDVITVFSFNVGIKNPVGLRYSVLSVSIPWRSLWEIKHLCP